MSMIESSPEPLVQVPGPQKGQSKKMKVSICSLAQPLARLTILLFWNEQ